MAQHVINISKDGEIEDSGNTADEKTHVKPGDRIKWNSQGNGPYQVAFTVRDKSPFFDEDEEDVTHETPIHAPSDEVSQRGNSRMITVKFDAKPGRYPYGLVRAGEARKIRDDTGPEVIVESGGG